MPNLHRRTFLQLVAAALPARLLAQAVAPAPSIPAPSIPAPSTPAMEPLPAPTPVKATEDRYAFGRVLPNGTTAFKVSSKDCRNDFFAMEHHHTAKGGPPRHLHHHEDEWFYVLEGEYLVEVGDHLHTLHAGDSVLGPRELSHAFACNSAAGGRLLITYAPAGRMEEFFDTRDRTAGGRTTYVNNAEKMHTYGMELLGPPIHV